MELSKEQKQNIMEVVAASFETGHFSELDKLEIAASIIESYPELDLNDQKRIYEQACEYYCELVNMGPAGFYAEFKDDYDFDTNFIAEYGEMDSEEE
jgi:hypothetical protein